MLKIFLIHFRLEFNNLDIYITYLMCLVVFCMYLLYFFHLYLPNILSFTDYGLKICVET